ncbi:hypothetical protein QBC44DRAFT_251596, partial [Cladorrhinum sp. PSN332]
VGLTLSNIITLPYYRFYRENTLFPVLTIAQCVRERQAPDVVSAKISNWRERKLAEYQFITVASTLLSAAVIGCFSWAPRETEHWLGPGSWYASLVLSMTSVLLASSQAFIFSAIKGSSERPSLSRELAMILRVHGAYHDDGSYKAAESRRQAERVNTTGTLYSRTTEHMKPAFGGGPLFDPGRLGDDDLPPRPGPSLQRDYPESDSNLDDFVRYIAVEVRWNMIFTWQAPMMLMAYSFTAFMIGLTVYITTPLYDGGAAAIVYLVTCGLAGLVFIWCSFWAYKFVDLQGRDELEGTARARESEVGAEDGRTDERPDTMMHRRMWLRRERPGEEA